jgi:hypothetical protein
MSFSVELLRDQRGIYGFGPTSESRWGPGKVILRPDMLGQPSSTRGAVLQKITGGLKHGPFFGSTEEQLRGGIHHEMLNRRGLPWPPENDRDVRWWSKDQQQRNRNRQIYHGLRLASLDVINRLIGQALEAADQDAVAVARRFAFRRREQVYRAAAKSRRAMQLFATFPVLALQVYREIPTDPEFASLDKDSGKQKQAAAQVERGARLRDIAKTMEVPMALRAIKPGVAHLVPRRLFEQPELVRGYLPKTTAQQRIWLHAIYAGGTADFVAWVARHVMEMPGGVQEKLALIENLYDWVGAREFITRQFVPSMSLRTVMELSGEWHEAVAQHMNGPNCTLPEPWFPPAKLHNGYEIVPLTMAEDLYLEGRMMHHCVGTYVPRVKYGDVYIYSVREGEQRIATAELIRPTEAGQPALGQLRGPCNALPPKDIQTAVKKWLRSQQPLPPHKPDPAALQMPHDDNFGADIPF